MKITNLSIQIRFCNYLIFFSLLIKKNCKVDIRQVIRKSARIGCGGYQTKPSLCSNQLESYPLSMVKYLLKFNQIIYFFNTTSNVNFDLPLPSSSVVTTDNLITSPSKLPKSLFSQLSISQMVQMIWKKNPRSLQIFLMLQGLV